MCPLLKKCFIDEVCLVSFCVYLLRRHVERDGPEVHTLVGVDAGDHEKQSWALETESYFRIMMSKNYIQCHLCTLGLPSGKTRVCTFFFFTWK
jgi:hypothetical protein